MKITFRPALGLLFTMCSGSTMITE